MIKKSTFRKKSLSTNILLGSLVGGTVGVALGLIASLGLLATPIEGIATLTILGILAGGVAGSLMTFTSKDTDTKEDIYSTEAQKLKKAFRSIGDGARIQLREEQFEISKELVQTAEVKTHTEEIKEEKHITVPITRTELVIEKEILNDCVAEKGRQCSEIIRIPISEEQIEVVKHPVQLEDVDIYTNKYEEIEHIEETLKREKLHIETSGDAKVVESNASEHE